MVSIHGICALVFVEKTYTCQLFQGGIPAVASVCAIRFLLLPQKPTPDGFFKGEFSGVPFDKGESRGYHLPEYSVNLH